MAGDGVGVAQHLRGGGHVAGRQGGAHRGAGHAFAMHLVAVHARHVKALPPPGGIQHGVVAGALGAEAEVVAHQDVLRPQALHQHVLDEGLGRLAGQGRVEGQHDHLVDAAQLELRELVAQRAHARRGQLGLLEFLREEVARVRFERQHAGGDAALRRLGRQQGQHGLVAAVHTVKIANRDGTFWRQSRVLESSENFHLSLCFL